MEKVVPRDTGRSYETTSRESLSPRSDVLLDEVVSSESVDSSMKRPEEF